RHVRHGWRSEVGAPLLSASGAIGTLWLVRTEVRPFTARQVRLLQTFADQAVIAIENARLFQELQERLEGQTAASEILPVISESPTDLPRVLDTLVRTALRLCDSSDAFVMRETSGGLSIGAAAGPMATATAGAVGEGPVFPLSRGSVSGRSMIERRTMHVV